MGGGSPSSSAKASADSGSSQGGDTFNIGRGAVPAAPPGFGDNSSWLLPAVIAGAAAVIGIILYTKK